MKFFYKVPIASSKCSFMWIKVDKQDYFKISLRNFKNSFYFGIVKVSRIPGMHYKLRLVIWPFRSRSKLCESNLNLVTPQNSNINTFESKVKKSFRSNMLVVPEVIFTFYRKTLVFPMLFFCKHLTVFKTKELSLIN